MPTPEQHVAMDEATRALLATALPKLPEPVSQAMLAEAEVRANLGLPSGDYVRLFDIRFDREELFRCLADVANDRPAVLRSHDGMLEIDAAELDAEGTVTLLSGTKGARFANAGMLSDDRDHRMRTFDVLLAGGELSAEREAQWRAALEAGPLDGALYMALEDTIEAIPEAVYRRLAAESDRGLTFEALVPDNLLPFAGLLGLFPPPPDLGAFEAAWSAAAVELDRTRLVRTLRLSAPLAVLRSGLIPTLSHRLEHGDRLALVRFLDDAGDPFSLLAAFEITAAFGGDADLRAAGDVLLPRLLDPEEPRTVSGASLLCSALVLTTAISARSGTLVDWPPYARRLAWFLHASHLVRIFGDGQIDPAEMARSVAHLAPGARLADLCDAAQSPFNLASLLTPAHVHAILLKRVNQVLEKLPDEQRPEAWVTAANAATRRALSSPTAILLVAPGPFDPFEPDWSGLTVLPRDAVEVSIAAIDAADDAERVMSDLFKLALALDAEPDQREAIAERLPKLLRSHQDRELLVTAECAIQLAARWRICSLSNAIVEILLARAGGPGLADPGAAPRFVLLAAACLPDPVEWRQRVGDIATRFSYVLEPGAPILNLRNAIGLMGDYAPALRAPLAPAQAYCMLTLDRTAAPAAGAVET